MDLTLVTAITAAGSSSFLSSSSYAAIMTMTVTTDATALAAATAHLCADKRSHKAVTF